VPRFGINARGLVTQVTQNAVRRGLAPLTGGNGSEILSFASGNASGTTPDGQAQGPMLHFQVEELQETEYTTQSNSIISRNTAPTHAISIYLPNELSVSYSTQYEEMSMGAVLGAADEGALAGLGAATSKLMDNAGRMIGSAVGLDGLQDLRNANQGKAFNPQMELLFKSVNFRQFTFNFKFHPANQGEADHILRIQKRFKYHMHPELEGAFFKYPDLFSVTYRAGSSGGEDYYHKFGKMVLTDMTINYAGTGVASQFKNGAPVETDMSLTFKEVEFLTKDRINQGY